MSVNDIDAAGQWLSQQLLSELLNGKAPCCKENFPLAKPARILYNAIGF